MGKRKANPEPQVESETESSLPAPEYTVLARRYRPKQFHDLIGQEAVAQALTNALEGQRVAHAYLFTGARGVGKTSTARILAKALNCVEGPTSKPCDKCETCLGISSGEDVDVLEIDGASNTGVENVRELRQNVHLRPTRSRYKVYIIDEVHMLSKAAFNALLKTLEEPPPHVKFIFATTEVQKIPLTILSRCQRFDFLAVAIERLAEHLRLVAKSEGKQIEDEAVQMIARRSGGSVRDSQSLLDQLLAFSGDKLSADQVHRVLGTADEERVIALADAILAADGAKALELVGRAADEGLQLAEFVDQLMEYWRDLMVAAAGAGGDALLSVGPAHKVGLLSRAKSMDLDAILAGLDVLALTKSRMRGSGQGRVLLEMAVVRLVRLGNLVSLAQLVQLSTSGKSSTAAPAVRPSSTQRMPVSPPEAQKKNRVAESQAPSDQVVMTEDRLASSWPTVLSAVGPMLKGHLERAGLPAISGPNTLVLRFPMGYNSDRDYCQLPSNIGRVEEALKRSTGVGWTVRIELAVGAAAAPVENPTPSESPTQSRYRRQRSEAIQEPLLRRAIDVLGAQIVRVDEAVGGAPAAGLQRPATAVNEEPDDV